MKIKTETESFEILSAFDLTDEEIGEFDYLEETEGSFFRYNGNVYDLGEFMRSGDGELSEWDGFCSETAFSGVLVKINHEDDTLTVGQCSC